MRVWEFSNTMVNGNSTNEGLARLEEFVGVSLSSDKICLVNQIQVLREELNEFKEMLQSMREEITVLKRVVAITSLSGAESHSKLKIPEPKAFSESRTPKKLENFLWDMDQYFKASHTSVEEQVTIIKLKDQFLLLNVFGVARENLKALKQSGSIRDYMKEFNSLLLNIKNMTEDDKVFNFMSGLKPWAQNELRRKAIKDLATTIIYADGLADYKLSSSEDGIEVVATIESDKGAGKDKKIKEKRSG
ncbi:hypothetical protein AgCh_008740 [Apium graveolens]